MSRLSRSLVLIVLLAAVAPSSGALAQDLRRVPADHWAYELAREVMLRHPELAGEAWESVRPWSEGEFRALVERSRSDEVSVDPSVRVWLDRIEGAFPAPRRLGEGVTLRNEVSAFGQADARDRSATFDPAFLGARVGSEVGAPEARVFARHDFGLQYSDRFALAGSYAVDSDLRNDPTRFRHDRIEGDAQSGVSLLEAYGLYRYGPLTVMAGRGAVGLGPGRGTSVFVSDSVPSMDQLRVELGTSALRFTGMIARLSGDPQNRSIAEDGRTIHGSEPPDSARQEVNRLLYLHRVDWRVHPRLRVAVSEAALVTGIDRGLEARYGNLLLPFFVTQLDEDEEEGGNVNLYAEVDATARLPGRVELWGAVLAQEFFIDEDKREQIGNQLAWRVGGEWGDPLGVSAVSVGAEYTRADVFMYLHRGLNTNWTHFGVPIGSSLGPDADQGLAWLWWYARPTVRFGVDAMVRRGGERSVETTESVIGAGNPEFPSGVVQRERRIGLEGWALWPALDLETRARVGLRDVDGLGLEGGASDQFWRLVVEARWRRSLP